MALNFAPTIEGLASQIYESLKFTSVDSPECTTSIRFPDATIDVLFRRNLIIVVSFDKQQMQEEDKIIQEEVKKPEEQEWKLVTKKNNNNANLYHFQNSSDVGYFDLHNMVAEEYIDSQSLPWSHTFSIHDLMIKEYSYQTCFNTFKASSQYIEHFNRWLTLKDLPKDLYIFQEASGWHTWKFVEVALNLKHAFKLVREYQMEWFHIFDPVSKIIYDFVNKSGCKRFCFERNATTSYLERFTSFLKNRDIFNKLPKTEYNLECETTSTE